MTEKYEQQSQCRLTAALALVTLFLACGQAGLAQDSPIVLGDRYVGAGNYEAAITEYKRFAFFHSDSLSVSEAYEKIGCAYREMAAWPESVEALRTSLAFTSNDSLRDERRIAVAVVLIADGNYSPAEMDLLRMFHFSDYNAVRKKALFFLGICQLYMFKWDMSEQSFRKYYQSLSENNPVDMESLFAESHAVSYKSPHLSKWLSTFLPGSGQLYCGDWKNSINALVLNSLTSYLFISSLYGGMYQDALICYLTPLERYYRGNRYHAVRIAEAYNAGMNGMTARKILLEIQKINSPETSE